MMIHFVLGMIVGDIIYRLFFKMNTCIKCEYSKLDPDLYLSIRDPEVNDIVNNRSVWFNIEIDRVFYYLNDIWKRCNKGD